MTTDSVLICPTCEHEVHPLAVFPGGLCLECYKQTPEATRPISADELAAMWSGRPARRRR